MTENRIIANYAKNAQVGNKRYCIFSVFAKNATTKCAQNA